MEKAVKMSDLMHERLERMGIWAAWLFGVLMGAEVICEMGLRAGMQLVVEWLREVKLRAEKQFGIE